LDSTSTAPSADVHLTLPAIEYDKVDRLSRQKRESIQQIIRRGLRRLLEDESG
jgi:hypothetical protein